MTITLGSDGYKTIWNDDKNFYISIAPQPTHAVRYYDAFANTLQARNWKTPTVLLSGGLDSEVAAIAVDEFCGNWLAVHMEFRYHGQLVNSHERYWVERFARRLGKRLNILSLELTDFFPTGAYLDYSVPYLCTSPQIAAHIWALSQIADPVILGGPLRCGENDSVADTTYHACYRYWNYEGKQGCELLQDSYELYNLSMHLPASIGQARDRTHAGKQKAFIYNSWGFDFFEFEERPKHTGFELIQQQYAAIGRDWNKVYRLNELSKKVPLLTTKFV